MDEILPRGTDDGMRIALGQPLARSVHPEAPLEPK